MRFDARLFRTEDRISTKKVPLTASEQFAVRLDGRIRGSGHLRDPGALDIIGPVKLDRKVRGMSRPAAQHLCHPISKYAIMALTLTSMFSVVDPPRKVVLGLKFGRGRPPHCCIDTNPDGIDPQVYIPEYGSDLNGFVVRDVAVTQSRQDVNCKRLAASRSSIIAGLRPARLFGWSPTTRDRWVTTSLSTP